MIQANLKRKLKDLPKENGKKHKGQEKNLLKDMEKVGYKEVKMNGIIITSIICGTLLLICLINKIGKK
jgi:hypothetical protein